MNGVAPASTHLGWSTQVLEPMLKTFAQRTLIVLVSSILTLVGIELGLRALGDPDGDKHLMGYRLQPARIDIYHARVYLERYLENVDQAALVYDPNLGWSYPPNAVLENGTFTTNSIGIRARQEYTIAPPADTLRIALIGDSFVAGVDVNDEESWARQLEIILNERGIRSEVMNFGVSGFGMGQAYLRWQHLAREYAPDLVIFGLQPENLNRNVNVFRTIYRSGDAVPLAKPRFILDDDGLRVVNSPVVPPEELIQLYRDLGKHPLAAYEYYYDSRHVSAEWWTESRLIVFLNDLLRDKTIKADDYSLTSERGRLGKAILDALESEVEASGAELMMIHFPFRFLLGAHHDGNQSPFHEFLEYAEEAYGYIPLEEFLGPEYVDHKYWGETYHYGPEISRVVAKVLANAISDCLLMSTCTFSRFSDVNDFLL